jgi:hypothetical protein
VHLINQLYGQQQTEWELAIIWAQRYGALLIEVSWQFRALLQGTQAKRHLIVSGDI